jgi:hypothetical protein
MPDPIEEPRPYVPPHRRPGADPQAPRKPWMSLPDNASRCWRCGVKIVDQAALAAHEDQCDGTWPDDDADDTARWKP